MTTYKTNAEALAAFAAMGFTPPAFLPRGCCQDEWGTWVWNPESKRVGQTLEYEAGRWMTQTWDAADPLSIRFADAQARGEEAK